MRRYIGNFDHFLQEKSKGIAVKESQLESFAKRKKDIQRFIIRFKAKASKARQAGSRERMIEKLEEEEKEYQLPPSTRQYPHFQFTLTRSSGQRALVIKDLAKSFGEHPVLKGVSFEVERFEKVAIVGPNGMGKSTLMEMITNHLAPDQGGARWGPHVKWGYFPQNFYRILSKEMTLYDWISGISKGVSDQKVRQTLGQMLFDEHAIRKKIGALSGGEGVRLVFAHLMLSEQNFLILDEPTNHLDMESVDALIQALKEYKGTLVMVSHNRHFISEVANRIIELRPTGLVDFRGGYEEFVKEHERDYLDQLSSKSEGKKKNYTEKKEERKERNRLKRDIERLEEEIASSEEKIEKVNEQLAVPGFYEKTPPLKQQKVINQKDALEKKRECDFNSWEDKMDEFSLKYLK